MEFRNILFSIVFIRFSIFSVNVFWYLIFFLFCFFLTQRWDSQRNIVTFLYELNNILRRNSNQNRFSIWEPKFKSLKRYLGEIKSVHKWLYLFVIYPKFTDIVENECFLLKFLFNAISHKLKNAVYDSAIFGHLVRERVFGSNGDDNTYLLTAEAATWILKQQVCWITLQNNFFPVCCLSCLIAC